MAMLKKTLFAVTCGSIAFSALAFAQAGEAAGVGGTGSATGAVGSMGSVGTAGTTGTGTGTGIRAGVGGINSTLSNNSPGMNGPGGTGNTPGINGTLAANGVGTINGLGASGTASGNLAGTTGAGGNAALGGNGVGVNNTLAGNRLGLGGTAGAVTNNLGTQGPAGTTSLESALATTPRATNNAARLSAPVGIVPSAGGNGFTNQPVVSSHAEAPTFPGLRIGDTVTPIRGLSARTIAKVSSRERHITAELNRAELDSRRSDGTRTDGRINQLICAART
jgi:hypothetical protein